MRLERASSTGFVVAFAAVLSLNAVPTALGEPRAEEPQSAPTPFIEAKVQKVKAGVGKLSEADVVEIFGTPPHSVETGRDGLTRMFWENSSSIHVVLVNGEAVSFSAGFSPHIKSNRINYANYRKLKLGMDVDDLKKILGVKNFDKIVDPRPDANRFSCHWEEANRIRVEFKQGKVTLIEWKQPTKE